MASISPTSVSASKETHTSKKGYLKFTVTSVTQSTSANTTTINWKLTVEGTPWVALCARYLKVGGKELVPLYTTQLDNWSAGQTVNSGSTTFNNNADGTLSLSVYIKQLFYYKYSSSVWGNSSYYQTGSGTMVCSTIPRYPVLSLGNVSTTLNTASCSISNTRTGTMTKYQVARVSDGTTLIDTTCNGSFTFTLTGLSPNTNYSGTFKVRGYANSGWGDWLTVTSNSMKTTTLPTVSSTSVEIDKTSVVQFNNLNYISSWSMTVHASSNDTQVASRSSITTNNYNFTLSESEKTALLKLYPNGNPKVYLKVTVVSNGTSYRVYNTGTTNTTISYTVPNNSTYAPTFALTNLTNVIDTKNTAITGNNKKFIGGQNMLQGTIIPMTPKYGATGKSYTITVGTKSTTLNYSSSNQTFTLENVIGDSVKVTAKDSRDKTTTINTTIDFVQYSQPSFNTIDIVRENGIGEYAMLHASGKYTNWSGLTKTNKVSNAKYRWQLAESGATWSSWSNIDATVSNSNGTWSIETILPVVFDVTKRYYIQLYVMDELVGITSDAFVLSTANVFIWKDLANKYFGINKKPDRELDVDGSIGATDALYINGIKVIWNE